jgi:predicted TIM-barrel fold metal-dependent hydrolase
MPGAIDIVINLHTPEVLAMRPQWYKEFLGDKIGADPNIVAGVTVDQYLERLDRAGIQIAFIAASKSGSIGGAAAKPGINGHPVNWHLPYEMVHEVVKAHPNRFRALAGIDPTEGMTGVRKLEHAVRELGFVGAHLYPHWFELPPDHRKYYPFYAKCVELDVPIQMQVGHCLRYSADRPLPSVGRPILLDTIACDFPELKLIGIHTGWPWVEEMISVAWKHPNVYIGSDAYGPRYWKPEFVHFINSWGQDKVLFGTDFPIVDFERATREIDELGLRPESKEKLLWKNAARVYGLDLE